MPSLTGWNYDAKLRQSSNASLNESRSWGKDCLPAVHNNGRETLACTVLMWLGFIANAYIIMLELAFRLSGLKKTDKASHVPLGMPYNRSWRSVEGSMFSMPLAMRCDPLCLRQHILTGNKLWLGWPWPLRLSSKRSSSVIPQQHHLHHHTSWQTW